MMRAFIFFQVDSNQFNRQPAYLIGIEMSILDVHVNRAPIQGKIVVQKRINGDFISLKEPEAALRTNDLKKYHV